MLNLIHHFYIFPLLEFHFTSHPPPTMHDISNPPIHNPPPAHPPITYADRCIYLKHTSWHIAYTLLPFHLPAEISTTQIPTLPDIDRAINTNTHNCKSTITIQLRIKTLQHALYAFQNMAQRLNVLSDRFYAAGGI